MSFTTEAFTLLGVGIAFIILRWIVRINAVGFRGLQADDFLMVLVVLSYSIETIQGYNVGALAHGLANNTMSDVERTLLDPNSDEYRWRVEGSKTQVRSWSAYACVLWCLKAAMCTVYMRLTDGLDGYRTRIYVGYFLIFITWVTVICCILFACRPFEKNWQINPNPGNVCQPAVSKVNLFTMVTLNGGTDLYLLIIPMPMLWAARMPLRRKLALTAVFSGGIFVTMAGVWRCVLILKHPIRGAEESGSWACRESFVAIITTNFPIVFPPLQRMILNTWEAYSPKRSGVHQPDPVRLEDHPPSDNGYLRRRTDTILKTLSSCPVRRDSVFDGSTDNLNQQHRIRRDIEVRIFQEIRLDDETERRLGTSLGPNLPENASSELDLSRSREQTQYYWIK
ncbi:hypothetical protein BGZ61DRAFT_533936 [Ilyonectria robusta]|uniref:uncharacterized protein n=1 Tax=Ilyonectria robusta TaxID=1079257 RepID=UPI001E8D4745|nr:uncharacterized protein BGZ61DRAFT_533936 [Ilyonectria robusta]KAH8686394.1 hypothetical protein BGZ61DRAFT_533936 [Ilyonectria robusta]